MQITAQMLAWIPLSIYVCAAIPQFITNYRRGSGSGLSHWMLFMRNSSGIFYNAYLFLCGLTLAHRILMPIYSSTLVLLAIQAYGYEKDSQVKARLRSAYSVTLLIAILGMMVASWQPQQMGMLFGWIGVAFALFCDAPQVYHNWRRKSVAGFNFLFASFIGIGALIEVSIALWFGLPWPTIANCSRAFSFYLIYCTQFLFYSR